MESPSDLARVVVADDDVLLREGLASLLERSGYRVLGQSGSAAELLALVREYKPDLAIVDIRMPPAHSTEGLDAARVIRAEFPQIAKSARAQAPAAPISTPPDAAPDFLASASSASGS